MLDLKSWLTQRWTICKYYWRWLWMSGAERKRATATRKLLFHLLRNAPMDKIAAGESCTWHMAPCDKAGAMDGVRKYVQTVKGKE